MRRHEKGSKSDDEYAIKKHDKRRRMKKRTVLDEAKKNAAKQAE